MAGKKTEVKDKKNINTSKVFAYNPSGKLLYKQQIYGEVLWAGRNRIVVNATNRQRRSYRIGNIEAMTLR